MAGLVHVLLILPWFYKGVTSVCRISAYLKATGTWQYSVLYSVFCLCVINLLFLCMNSVI